MSVNRIYKFNDINEMQYFMNGAIIGANVALGIGSLAGLVLTFTSPAFAVTFGPVTPAPTTRDAYNFMLADIKTQVEAASPDILVSQFGGRIVFSEKVPTNGVALAANVEPAKTLLGFDGKGATVGRVFRPLGVSGGPNFSWVYSISETSHVLLTWE